MAFLLPKLNLNQLSLIEDTSSFLMRMHMHSYSILRTLENKTEHSTKITSRDKHTVVHSDTSLRTNTLSIL